MGFPAERRRWRVRLRDHGGRIHGAGTMLDEDHVLTCAHVVEDAGGPEAELSVDFVGMRESGGTVAKVVPGAWFPPARDERGDIAVLRLANRQPGSLAAPLHRMLPARLGPRALVAGSDRRRGRAGLRMGAARPGPRSAPHHRRLLRRGRAGRGRWRSSSG
ncbi:trypsin-like peptidase domain-containing protein [Amycolatopsis carbonis]|uniref:Trypsin-like peptidase domain-containing protein n=1 Tax=Amycolatopsis carbonis TaxID=715471 RepID=A0A9Y2I8B3_9PSEU|nr:trypsin-like peptidase domain-containing protein [Amycolatopsis sp. 2-15]WIX75179.1 trypsin-like peptidase domain-containing protein [Amycolatopsis sp. 2-15]